jgi:hypothetical protein
VGVNSKGEKLYAPWPTQFYRDNMEFVDGLGTACKVLYDYIAQALLILLNIATVIRIQHHAAKAG